MKERGRGHGSGLTRTSSTGSSLSSGGGSARRAERVQVVVRCRPMLVKENAEGRNNCVLVDTVGSTIQVKNLKQPEQEPKLFTFDKTYDATSTQKQLYDDVAHPIVHSVMCGYNGTVLAYGQTASGKTFTMDGLDDPPEMRGIIPQAFEGIFTHIQDSQSSDNFLVRASYLEIHNEEIRDLLATGSQSSSRLELKENVEGNVYVKNLTSITVQSVADISHLLTVGKKSRSVGATLMNQDSSRSHSIFTITVEASARSSSAETDGSMHIRVGKLNLVDLAGSERLNKTGATGDRFRELTNINWSLSALGNVISALVDDKSSHVPYRDSKLTRLLQDSLGGNTRTVMIANIGPADYNYDESVSTLRYANRAKSIKNKPRINEDPKDAILREFQEEIARLRAQLQASSPVLDERTPNKIDPSSPSAVDLELHMQQLRAKMQEDMEHQVFLHKSMSDQAMACIKADFEQKTQSEMQALKAEKERSDEEKQRIAQQLQQQHVELQSHYQALAREKEDRDVLAAKLRALEEKLVHGTNNDNEKLLEKAKQKEVELALREQQLQEKENMDEERQRKIAELEEAQLMAEEKCNTMEEEVEMKTRKLRKLMARYQQSKNDINALRTELQDTIHEFQRERADMFLSLRSLDQQLQLKNFLIDKFISPEDLTKVMRRVHWDEENEIWNLVQNAPVRSLPYNGPTRVSIDGFTKQPLLRPNSAIGRSRPPLRQPEQTLSQSERDRYLVDNILKKDQDVSEGRNHFEFGDNSQLSSSKVDIEHALREFRVDNKPSFTWDREPQQVTPAAAGARPKSARTKQHNPRPRTAR
ncbi:uncharacterized protein [Physcomitrium patens]|uniref:uncharacterized protein isoform X3 n=1 Tax=Physcomitrium patens TaxID=3218 RepID=UPI000D15B7E4|nr:kinesin-II 95 kDa subunit-like [Physcomitrium patens]|eukprot:XP_024374792.1 kinesin-II 95 kDa subunit-like [Physcomitrella patens]